MLEAAQAPRHSAGVLDLAEIDGETICRVEVRQQLKSGLPSLFARVHTAFDDGAGGEVDEPLLGG